MKTDRLADLAPRRRSLPAAAACIDAGLIARAGKLLKVLKLRKLTIVTTESCTAGLISAALSQAEGAGEILHGSFVTYTKANKSAALGVSPELLRTEGSVNAAVVKQLAGGALAAPADRRPSGRDRNPAYPCRKDARRNASRR
jgi:nicotinamide-nucleotide amidase